VKNKIDLFKFIKKFTKWRQRTETALITRGYTSIVVVQENPIVAVECWMCDSEPSLEYQVCDFNGTDAPEGHIGDRLTERGDAIVDMCMKPLHQTSVTVSASFISALAEVIRVSKLNDHLKVTIGPTREGAIRATVAQERNLAVVQLPY
jgi:hypothetical protein